MTSIAILAAKRAEGALEQAPKVTDLSYAVMSMERLRDAYAG